jgi:Domain of unknown function (DUF4340)
MRSRNLIILASLAIVLGAFIFFVERHQPTTNEREERADRVFPDLDGDAVVAMELKTSNGPVRLAKTDDEWRLVEPLDYQADAAVVKALVDAVSNLDIERTLPVGEISPADYGLDAPVLEVTLVDAQDRRFSLAVGLETPLGSNRAVKRDGGEEIILVPGFFVASLDKDVDEWRSRDVVDLLEHDLASVEIETDDDRIRVVRGDGRWLLEEPMVDLADPDQMRSLVSELNTLRVSEFLPKGADASELGLDSPAFRVLLKPKGDDQALTLEFAATDDEAGTIACRRNGSDLFLVPPSIGIRLSKAPVLWRSDKVWPLVTWDVAKIEFSVADEDLVFDKIEDAEGKIWRFDDGSDADNPEVSRRLSALADLEIREHDLILPPTEVMGSVLLVLDNDQGAEGLTFTFYSPIEEGGHAAVTVSTRGNVMGVDAISAETIVGNLELLRPAASGAAEEDDAESELE